LISSVIGGCVFNQGSKKRGVKVKYRKISGEVLSESEDEKAIYMIENGNEAMVGATTEIVKIVLLNDREAIERTQTLNSDVLGNRKSITLVDKSSFRPISFTDYSGDIQTLRATYDDNEVTITGSNKEEKVKLVNNCFDTFSVEVILRTLPLEPGYSLKINCFNATLGKEVAVNIRVLGSEQVLRYPDEYTDAWKVETYFGETLQYYWIDTLHKELLQQSSVIGEGLVLEFRR
jgi:hypothetical protein